MSPPDRGGGVGRGHQPGRDAAVGGWGAQPCPVPLPTPSLRVWPRWGAGTRGGDTLVAEGTPPGRAKQAGAGGTRSMLGARGGTRPCVAAVGDTGVRGNQPCAGWGARAGGAPTWPPKPPRPPPGALSPPRCSPGEPCPYLGVPTALLPLPVSRLRRGDCGGCCFPPAGGWGGRMEPKGQGKVQGPSLAQGPGGQAGVQGPPLAQPLMSPVQGAG